MADMGVLYSPIALRKPTLWLDRDFSTYAYKEDYF
jgi:hypothetical protein